MQDNRVSLTGHEFIRGVCLTLILVGALFGLGQETAGRTVVSGAPETARETAPLPAQAASPDLERLKMILRGEITKILEETNTPSISIALTMADEVIWAEAFGYSNLATRTPATEKTVYATGSTFKFVTATAVLKLVEQGKLDVDTPINEYLGDLAIEGADEVTLRHVLSHTSGLEGPGDLLVAIWGKKAVRSLQDLAGNMNVVRPPGQEYRYCNECYGLAGYIIETASGQSYDEFVSEHILEPTGVSNARPTVPSPEIVQWLALPYTKVEDVPQPNSQLKVGSFPAGGAYLTPTDMARFLMIHLNNGIVGGREILSPESIAELRRKVEINEERGYALGTRVDAEINHTVIAHDGQMPGFYAVSKGDVDAQVGVYLMSNSGEGNIWLNALGELALGLLRGEETRALPSFKLAKDEGFKLTEELITQYLGRYMIEKQGWTIDITRADTQLYLNINERSLMELTPRTADLFLVPGVDFKVDFYRDEDGNITSLKFSKGADGHVAVKNKSQP